MAVGVCVCATRDRKWTDDNAHIYFIFRGPIVRPTTASHHHLVHPYTKALPCSVWYGITLVYSVSLSYLLPCRLVIKQGAATVCSNRRKYTMSSCTTSIYGQGGGRRFLTFGVYILLVLFGFLMNVHIIQDFSTGCVPSPASATTNHDNQIKNGGTLSACGALSTSVPIFWKQFESEIKEAAVENGTTFYPEDQNNKSDFHAWVDELFQDHYQSYQVRRSAIHPPGLEVTLKLLEIISKRVNYLKDNTLPAAPPLHILVIGGSLTSGMACGINHLGLKTPGWMRQYTECAWPNRLQHLFNRVLFNGEEVVKVSNLAVGGSNSEVGKTLLEYQLFPDAFQQPDIVIWSHAANDAQEKDKEKAYFESIPGFVNAAHNLQICDDHLPLVVINEEFFGQQNDISGAIYKASNWFGLMGISQRNVISHKIFANFDNDDYVKKIIGDKGLHPGMGAHIGASWTVFYNFISAFTDVCDYTKGTSSLARINSSDLTAKSIGPYKEYDYGDISSDWKQHKEKIREMCVVAAQEALLSSNNSSTATTSFNQQQESPCTYAFMQSRMTSVATSKDVNKKLNEILTSNTGWKAEGYPEKQPRAGFYAQQKNAHFSLKIDSSMQTKYMTILSMKSYGDNFIDTNLEVDVRIERKGGSESTETQAVKYEVSGYHDTRTSIHIPHKFELPDGGAKKDDSIVANFRLVSGSYFKIAGLAFCMY